MPNNKINKNALFAKVRNTLSKKPKSLGSLINPVLKPSNIFGGKCRTSKKINHRNKKTLRK